jgi:hypothetical protein
MNRHITVSFHSLTNDFWQFINDRDGSLIGVDRISYPTEKMAEDYAREYVNQ